MTLQEFVNKYLGKKIDFDGFYGGQCVDLYRQYIKEVLNFPQSPGVGGAAEIWESASPTYYTFITNTPEGIPLPGDIVIWNRRVGGGFGHVAVFVSSQDLNNFISFDQNWPTLDVCTLTKHNYTNVIGWLHPKEIMNADEIAVKKTDFENLVHKSSDLDTVLAKYQVADIQALFNMVAGYVARITDLGNQLGQSQAQVKNDVEIISRREAELLTAKNDVKALLDRIEEAAKSIDQLGKDKGTLAIQLAQLQVQYDSLKAGQGQGLTKDSTIQQVVNWFKELFFRN